MESPLNRNLLRIEAKKIKDKKYKQINKTKKIINLLPHDVSPNRKVFPNRPKKSFPNS